MAPCNLCRDLRKKDVDDPRLAVEMTASQLLNVTDSGTCDVCLFIVDGILRFEDPTWTLEKDVSRLYLYALSERGDTLSVDIYFRTEKPKLVLEFFRATDKQLPWSAIRQRTCVTRWPFLPNGIRWAQSSIENCLLRHKSCAGPNQPVLPKRTLGFRKLGNGKIIVRLQENTNAKDRYIALSHCWGSAPACTTTSKNISAYHNSVPWDALPTTFQDSIIISLELGVKHLWVDALCIVQDSTQDWEIESSRMADVYQNAYLTIAATTSSNGNEGCFSVHRRPIKQFPLTVNGLMVREKVSHWQIPPTKTSLQSYPLLSRGWALQERYLSPRVLHFCTQELVWECLEQLVCECGGISAPCGPLERSLISKGAITHMTENRLGTLVRGKLKLKNLVTPSFRNGGSRPSLENADSKMLPFSSTATPIGQSVSVAERGQMSDQWRSIIEQYTPLKLSKERDRLPALSGLAMRASLFLGTYLCGLWLQTITNDLMWRVPMLEHGFGRPAHYTGPSWSWASINGAVAYWHDLDEQRDIEEITRLQYDLPNLETRRKRREAKGELRRSIKERRPALQRVRPRADCDIVLAGENPYGEVILAKLRVTGRLAYAQLRYVSQYSEHSTYANRQDPLKYELNINLYDRLSDRRSDLDLPFFADYILSEGPHSVPVNSTIALLRVRHNVGLVLRACGDGTYQRIGIVRQPRGYLTLYGLDWMSGSKNVTIWIV